MKPRQPPSNHLTVGLELGELTGCIFTRALPDQTEKLRHSKFRYFAKVAQLAGSGVELCSLAVFSGVQHVSDWPPSRFRSHFIHRDWLILKVFEIPSKVTQQVRTMPTFLEPVSYLAWTGNLLAMTFLSEDGAACY